MGGVPTKRHTRSKVGRNRSHLAKKPVAVASCPECKSPRLPHRACAKCGHTGRKKKEA